MANGQYCALAFPQPQPGTALAPGPIKDVPAGKFRSEIIAR
jgi:hypothetical protein